MLKQNLGGEWRVTQGGQHESIPAQVPGCVHTDLLAAAKIDDPYYCDNENAVQWIGETDWTYSRSFHADPEMLAQQRVLLRCEGLDTFATITLNGERVAQTNNMYRTWEFDIRGLLRDGENNLDIHFASTIPYIDACQRQRKLPGWNGPREMAGRAWVRKEPCNYGWDWGPVLVTCGIWRPIELAGFSNARLADMQVLQDHADGKVKLTVKATCETVDDQQYSTRMTVSYGGKIVAEAQAPVTDSRAAASLTITDPLLWWPFGMGEQPLYEVDVILQDADARPVDATVKRIGLRTLHLERKPDQWGESFQFVINGIPYFAKGANWIPADAFINRITPQHYRRLLEDAVAANMNMLRVWGGGIYEQDCFYDICDELGITIWQDFMFACSTYPGFDIDFLANVEAETQDNVRRLRHHPCIALWCGNNELEMGLVNNGWSDNHMSWEDYSPLFDSLLPEVLSELDPQRDYWPSSAHTPVGDRSNANDPASGDAHLWEVWHGKKPFEWYRTCMHRFCSEFGFQSFPEPVTVNGYTQPQDRNITSYVMEHHQRSGIGNSTIIGYMLDWYRLPTDFEMTLWLSQILQGMAMKYAVEHWRRNMPRTMGTLYWQLNDCWPVASWASIDYHGRWKALHYMAKQFNAPLLVSGVENLQTGDVEVHVTSDLGTACPAELTWTLTTVDGKRLAEGMQHIEAAPRANTLVETLPLKSHLDAYGPRNLLLWLSLESPGQPVSTNFVTFARPKHLELLDPKIAVAVDGEGESFTVTFSAEHPALWAWLELEGVDARYSDNFFHLLPGVPYTITVTPSTPLTADAFRRAVRVRSLVDTYRAVPAEATVG